MYEELLPFWKIRCKMRQERSDRLGLAMTAQDSPWTYFLAERGIYEATYNGGTAAPKTGTFQWVEGEGDWDCLVLGVMLFTWEQGITP